VTSLTVGSLFAGIGGFDLGFERAGFTVRWQVEIDPWARRVLERHWPHVQRHDDIRTASAATLPPVDVLVGGFPCQDISLAGTGAGIADGTRSGLWAEYARLIGELRPRYVVVENVAALRSRGLGRVLGDLAACGYDAEWDCLPAAAVGAPHRRDRLWLVAYPHGRRCQGQRLAEPAGQQGARGREPDRRGTDGHQHDTTLSVAEPPAIFRTRGREKGRAIAQCDWWAVEPPVGRVVDGLPGRVDRLRGLGNAIVPQIAQYLAERILAREAFLNEGETSCHA
jgi:DNA (cytosine-5)-methyltransferase 1